MAIFWIRLIFEITFCGSGVIIKYLNYASIASTGQHQAIDPIYTIAVISLPGQNQAIDPIYSQHRLVTTRLKN